METVTIIIIGAALAGFAQGLSGFAFGMVAMAVWAWVLDPQLAAVLTVFGGMIGQIIGALTVRRAFETGILLPLLAGASVGIPLGILILPYLDAALFKITLGGVLVICCPVMLAAANLPHVEEKTGVSDATAGLIAGVLGGIGGFVGIVPTLWYTLRGLEKDRLRSIVQNFNLATLTTTMAGYLAAGLVTRDTLPMFALVVPAMLIPWFIGASVYHRMSTAAFRRIVLWLLTATGLAMLASSLPSVLQRLY